MSGLVQTEGLGCLKVFLSALWWLICKVGGWLMYGCLPGLWLVHWSTVRGVKYICMTVTVWRTRPCSEEQVTGWDVTGTSCNLRNSQKGFSLWRWLVLEQGPGKAYQGSLFLKTQQVRPWANWCNWPVLVSSETRDLQSFFSTAVILGINYSFKPVETSVRKCGSLGREEHYPLWVKTSLHQRPRKKCNCSLSVIYF